MGLTAGIISSFMRVIRPSGGTQGIRSEESFFVNYNYNNALEIFSFFGTKRGHDKTSMADKLEVAKLFSADPQLPSVGER